MCIITYVYGCVCSVVSDSLEPIDASLPGSSVHGIFQARTLECVAIPSPGDLHQTGISCIGRWILYHWATWEAPGLFSFSFFTFCDFLFWWFHYLTWPPNRVLKYCLVLRNARSLQCTLKRTSMLGKLCSGLNYRAVDPEFDVS